MKEVMLDPTVEGQGGFIYVKKEGLGQGLQGREHYVERSGG